LATGTLAEESLEFMRLLRINCLNRFGYCAPPSQLPRFKEYQLREPSEKPPTRAVFPFTGYEITLREKGSQENHDKTLLLTSPFSLLL